MQKYFLLFFLILFLNFNLFSQDQTDEIIISSTKLPQEKIVGSSVYIISKEDIKNYPSDTIPELLTRFPGVKLKDLYGTGFGVKQSIDIRGFGDTAQSNTVILLNGQRLTNIDLNLVDFSAIPKESIDRIEIIVGNSSVLYGNNASAGSINIITNQSIKRNDDINTKFSFGSLGKFENYISGTKSFKNFSVKGNQNQIFSNGYRRNNEYSQTNGGLEIAAKLREINYYLNFQSINQRIDLPGDVGVNTGNYSNSNGFHIDPRSSDTPQDFSQKNGLKLFYGFNYIFDSSSKLILDGAIDYLKNEGMFISSNSFTDARISNYQLTPRLISNQKIFGFNSDIIFGFDFNYTYYYQDKMREGETYYRKYKAQDKSLGLYFNNNISITPKDKISIGARFQGNWVRIGDAINNNAIGWTIADNETQIFKDPQFAYHLGYERIVDDKNILTAKIGKSFRYPNVDERIGFGFTTSSHNFGLNSQNSYDFDFGHKFITEKVNIQTSLYYMRLRNEVSYDNSTFTNRNLAKTVRYGIEQRVTVNLFDGIKLTNNFTLTQSKYRAGHRRNLDLTGIPAYRNNFEVEFQYNEFLSLFSNIYYQSSHRMINDVENYQVIGMPYHLVNAGLKGNFRGFNYSLEFNNILNKSYYNYAVASTSSYNVYNTYPKEGFNSFLTLSKSFN